MAVTAIWPIKGRVDKVIDYARNPEKTTEAGLPELAALHAVDNVVEYAADEMKTERRSYVSCLNCREDTAAAQFMETKRLWGKPGGRVCYHGYQSFKADEVTAETAHEIGVRLAEELWGGRFEVVVATHCNTGHYHNHFVINSVSWADGKKFYNSPADYARMREVSDRLCREYAISVIEDPGRQTKDYAEWQAERDGKPTHRGAIRADIDRAIRIIRETEEDAEVVPNLMIGFGIDQIQAEFVADIRLRNINKEYILKRTQEVDSLEEEIADLQDLVNSPRRIRQVIISELEQVKKKYALPRRTDIVYDHQTEELLTAEEEVPDYPVNLFLSREGYLKKITPQSLRMSGEQKYKDGDGPFLTWEASNRDELLVFTDRQQCYKTRLSEFEDTKASVLGDYLPTKLGMDPGEGFVWALSLIHI